MRVIQGKNVSYRRELHAAAPFPAKTDPISAVRVREANGSDQSLKIRSLEAKFLKNKGQRIALNSIYRANQGSMEFIYETLIPFFPKSFRAPRARFRGDGVRRYQGHGPDLLATRRCHGRCDSHML